MDPKRTQFVGFRTTGPLLFCFSNNTSQRAALPYSPNSAAAAAAAAAGDVIRTRQISEFFLLFSIRCPTCPDHPIDRHMAPAPIAKDTGQQQRGILHGAI